ncbi:MAG: hypothetical protein IJT32_00810 [Lachnospiraceae bacterium]|nr:hypothetical protein [Lachnospiraceae bacterium]
MAIFDIFEEVSEKSVIKTETGDSRIFGVMVGEVVNNYSATMPGRVCVSIHVRDAEANIIKWARLSFASFGEEWGAYFLPEVGDQVLVAFDQGLIDRPFVIGCIAKDNSKFLRKVKSMTNSTKRITTKNGNTIDFSDNPVGEGSMDAIKIYTPDSAHELTLDNEKHKITLKDKDNNAAIEMSSLRGDISITAAHKMSIKVGETITVTMNGDTGKITISANAISAETTGKMILDGGGKAEFKGATVTVDSQGMLSLNSAGMVKVEGKPIKLG